MIVVVRLGTMRTWCCCCRPSSWCGATCPEMLLVRINVLRSSRAEPAIGNAVARLTIMGYGFLYSFTWIRLAGSLADRNASKKASAELKPGVGIPALTLIQTVERQESCSKKLTDNAPRSYIFWQ